MARTIPIATSNTRPSDAVRALEQGEGPIEIEERGKTVAVLLSPAEYEAINRERAWNAIDAWRARNRDKSSDEIYREVTKIIEEVRQEMYEEKLAGSGGC
jgi:prevent-host-death family protein